AVWRRRDQVVFTQFAALPGAAVLEAGLAARGLDEDAAHGLGGGTEEVAAVFKVLIAHQPQVSFVDQCRGVERLSRFLLRELLRRKFPELFVNQRQELLGGLWVALGDSVED